MALGPRQLDARHLVFLSETDASTPTIALRAIVGVEAVREKLRTAVQSERDRKRVRALDVDDPSTLE